ncbi:MAG TPA: hypothetical protein DEF42_00725 [Desulfosporosinus sp.]|nr:hypothetical protein [Desulfosporosinus sp.]
MSMSFMPGNSGFPAYFPQACPPSSSGCPPKLDPCSTPLDPKPPCDFSFKRLVPLLESPAVGTGILALTFFFFIAFLSDPILANITSLTLGIVVTISTLAILSLIIFILFLL